MAGDPHLALDLANGIGDAQHQWLQAVIDAGAGRGEQFVAADGHHRAVDGVFDTDPPGLDIAGQEARQPWPFHWFWLGHRAIDGLHRDLAQGMNVLEYRLGVGGEHEAQGKQQCQ
ncbi:hypothetical protein D9M71_790670 [compost metagenome]